MSAPTWDQRIVQLVTWLVAYLFLLAARGWFERWLLARFQNRRGLVPFVPPMTWTPKSIPYALLAIGNVLVGAMIPLAPPIPMGEQQLAFHLFGQVDAGALYILASIWVSAILLTLVERGGLRTGGSILDIASRTLLSALPLLLIVLSLIVAGGAVDPRGEGSLHLGALIALQGRWGGVRWLAMGQPLAFILWLACAPLVSGEAQAHGTLAKHAMSLNLTLLTGALFVGGWQGPWVESTPWLGLLYTGLKVLTITFVGAWAAASLARPALEHRVRTAWTVYTPLSAANLIVTAVVTVLRSS